MSAASSDDEDAPPDLIPTSSSVRAARAGAGAGELSNEPSHAAPSAVPPAAAAAERRVTPITILTGWLGAGKTTLVKHLVTQLQQEGRTIAVINNEAGATGVEDQIRLDGDGEAMDVVELGNGCVCCSVKNDFLQAVETLLSRRSFDFVLVECSGMANPGQVAAMLWVDDELESNVALDGVVCVVDALNLERNLADPAGASLAEQLAFADAVLLNKCDLVAGPPARLDALEARVRSLNGVAAVHRTSGSRVGLSSVLGLAAYSTEAAQKAAAAALDHRCGSHCHHDASIHTEVVDGPDGGLASLERLKRWLAELLWSDEDAVANKAGAAVRAGDGPVLFRYKAVLAVGGDTRRHHLQGVQSLFDVAPGAEWADGERPFSRLVVIGRNLDRAALERGFLSVFGEKK